MDSADRRTLPRTEAGIGGIAGLGLVQALAAVLTIIPLYRAWHSIPRAVALLVYALMVAALAFGLFRWRRPVFPIILALLVVLANVDYLRRGEYVGLIPGAIYFVAYAIGVALTWRLRRASTAASTNPR